MALAESELARLGPGAVLGALRALERAGSLVGLLGIALVAGASGYANATLAVAVWVLCGAGVYALTILGERRDADTRATAARLPSRSLLE
jgi:uncharacterized membrane protein YuzA (DUF378 family)